MHKGHHVLQDHLPCFYPLVWTENGPNSHNQPDPRDIANACANASTSDNQKCNPYCNKNDGMCVKMTYTLIDGSGILIHYYVYDRSPTISKNVISVQNHYHFFGLILEFTSILGEPSLGPNIRP